ncbi:TetR/AcrR family transcriptional regulator [Mycobacterium sp. 21AC1]|uniref:TetR/AcrR family transcriptional regulator n=1 Tax=[Mycobacterium] appelbergii TaxID=2939269 RepID=UPI002938D5DB|nr:helix-turn-helix domain-containing protein [Mycobacterium sp. 21AC1]MDV3128426.1 TetR/AcrR family transcriptional regulator [Mycobacterium sp. 21AC1]
MFDCRVIRGGSGERAVTEAKLIEATRSIMERDGILSGLNLRELADEAEVTRGLIYMYFGSRRDLSRAALVERIEEIRVELGEARDLPFAARRRGTSESVIHGGGLAAFEALLALDGDNKLQILIDISGAMKTIERDKARGHFPADADDLALIATTFSGYSLFREALAHDVEMDVDILDKRLGAFESLLSAMK